MTHNAGRACHRWGGRDQGEAFKACKDRHPLTMLSLPLCAPDLAASLQTHCRESYRFSPSRKYYPMLPHAMHSLFWGSRK